MRNSAVVTFKKTHNRNMTRLNKMCLKKSDTFVKVHYFLVFLCHRPPKKWVLIIHLKNKNIKKVNEIRIKSVF